MTSIFTKQSESATCYAKVVIDFEPSVSHEVALQKGDVVRVTYDIDDFWYEGQVLNNGLQGKVF